MPIVDIENVGLVGVITDVPGRELPPEAWTAALNVRFENNKAVKSMGQQTTMMGTPSVAPHWLLPWNASSGYRWIYASTATVYYVEGATHTNITRYTTTPGDDNYTAGTRPTWTGGILHGVPILNHSAGTDYPQQWNGATSRLQNLTNWPASTYCKVMRPFKNYLVALDVTESSTNYPYMIRWSHPADPGSVPSSWDYTSATVEAGRHTIAESGGHLVDCKPLGAINVLYKEDATWAMRPVGYPWIFSFDVLSNAIGALSQHCIAEFYKNHFIVGHGDVVLFDGISPRSIITKKLRTWLFNSMDDAYFDKTIVTAHPARQEMHIYFVEAGASSDYLNKALIWNWTDNTFTVRDLPDIAFAAPGRVDANLETFDSVSGTFETDYGIFGDPGVSPADIQVLLARAYSSSQLLQLDDGYTDRGTSYTSYLERTDLTIVGRDRHGNPKTDPASIKFLRGVYPKVSADIGTTLEVSVGASDTPNGAVSWEGPYTFTVGTDVKVDCAISGKYLAVKFADSNTVKWELTGYSLDLDVISRL